MNRDILLPLAFIGIFASVNAGSGRVITMVGISWSNQVQVNWIVDGGSTVSTHVLGAPDSPTTKAKLAIAVAAMQNSKKVLVSCSGDLNTTDYNTTVSDFMVGF